MQTLKEKGKLNSAQLTCFNSPRPKEELYDIINDPFELKNLAKKKQYDSVLTKLRKKMDEIREHTNDVLPDKRTPDEFDRETGQPNKYRIRPRPSKAGMWKVYQKGD